MLPRFPRQLRRIDTALLQDHSRLAAHDRCEFLWEYVPHRPPHWCAANHFIHALKLKPSVLARRPSRLRHKHAALAHAGRALRRVLLPSLLDEATFVPMPCSKVRGGCDHDDRMVRVLRRAFGTRADVRELLRMGHSLEADHENRVRCSAGQLRRALCVAEQAVPYGTGRVPEAMAVSAPRRILVVVDDVLNSGKHFKVAQALLREHWPDREVRGLFLARCVRTSTRFQS